MDKLDSVSRNKLPIVLKNDICKAIENHCFNSGLRLDLDVTALASLPEHLVVMFSKLLRHASNIDHRSKELVLDVIKIIGDADGSYDRNVAHDISTNVTPSAADNKDSPAGHQNIDHPGKNTFFPDFFLFMCLNSPDVFVIHFFSSVLFFFSNSSRRHTCI